MRRYVGGHAHGDAGGAVHQQVGGAGRQHQRLGFGLVVVETELHGFLVEVEQQFMGDSRQANFGVAHGRRGIAVHRAEISLAVNQRITHGKSLGHAHDGVVYRGVAVGMILADYIPHHPRGFFVGLVVVVAEHRHGIQHAPMNRFQAVANVRQGAPDDDAHGVIQIGASHLLFEIGGNGLLGESQVGHGRKVRKMAQGFRMRRRAETVRGGG